MDVVPHLTGFHSFEVNLGGSDYDHFLSDCTHLVVPGSTVPLALDPVSQWFWILCPSGSGSCFPVVLDPVSQWLWILCPSGSGSCVPVALDPVSRWL